MCAVMTMVAVLICVSAIPEVIHAPVQPASCWTTTKELVIRRHLIFFYSRHERVLPECLLILLICGKSRYPYLTFTELYPLISIGKIVKFCTQTRIYAQEASWFGKLKHTLSNGEHSIWPINKLAVSSNRWKIINQHFSGRILFAYCRIAECLTGIFSNFQICEC